MAYTKYDFEVSTAVSTKMAVLWAVAPCWIHTVLMMEAVRICETSLDSTRLHGATTHNTDILLLLLLSIFM
jgi:hypothetical protein